MKTRKDWSFIPPLHRTREETSQFRLPLIPHNRDNSWVITQQNKQQQTTTMILGRILLALLLVIASLSPHSYAQKLRGVSDAHYSGIYLLMTETCDEKGNCSHSGTGEYWCIQSQSNQDFPKHFTSQEFHSTLQDNQRFWKVSYFPSQSGMCKTRRDPGCSTASGGQRNASASTSASTSNRQTTESYNGYQLWGSCS